MNIMILTAEKAEEMARSLEATWNSRDPLEMLYLFCDNPIWHENDNSWFGYREIRDALASRWSRTLFFNIQVTVKSFRGHTLVMDSKSEWQDAVQGQWYRTEGSVNVTCNGSGHFMTLEFRTQDIPITAAERFTHIRFNQDVMQKGVH